MRKSRVKFTDIDDKLLGSLIAEPDKFFLNLEKLSIQIPDWSKLILVTAVPEKQSAEVAFFEDAKDFFLSYTKRIIRQNYSMFLCFSRELTDDWHLFAPPTLIGTNLKTKLRG